MVSSMRLPEAGPSTRLFRFIPGSLWPSTTSRMILQVQVPAELVLTAAQEQGASSGGNRRFRVASLSDTSGSTQHHILCQQTPRDLEAVRHKARCVALASVTWI